MALMSDLSDLSDLSDKVGAPWYTPGVCGALSGLARAKMCRWVTRAFLMAAVARGRRGCGACEWT